jgi:hypothetical protein
MGFAGQPLSQLLHFQPLPICKTLVFGALKDLERWVFLASFLLSLMERMLIVGQMGEQS